VIYSIVAINGEARLWLTTCDFLLFLWPPGESQSIVISVSACFLVCLSVCLSARSHESKTTWPIFTKFWCMLPVAWIGRPLTALRYIKHFRFVDDITFWYHGANGPFQAKRSISMKLARWQHHVRQLQRLVNFIRMRHRGWSLLLRLPVVLLTLSLGETVVELWDRQTDRHTGRFAHLNTLLPCRSKLSKLVRKQEAFEKCWAHSLLRAAVTLPVTRCR